VARRPLPRAVPRPPPEGHRVSKLPPTLAPSYYDLFESLFLLSASSVSAMRVCDQLYRLNSVFTDIVVWRVNPLLPLPFSWSRGDARAILVWCAVTEALSRLT
jgi:hypothetical protein